MTDHFERHVRAAAVAGWWVVLAAAGLFTVSWLGYLYIVPARPSWLLTLWGPDISWEFVENVWFWGIAEFKLIVWLMAVAALWLTLWARQLRKTAGGP
jgi:hypothetical protein